MPLRQAIEHVRSRRGQVKPNSGFLIQLQSYGTPFIRTPSRQSGTRSNPGSLGSSPVEDFSMIPLFPKEKNGDYEENYDD